ncbi:MAG: glucose-6-phosphate isomerase [Bdellovibrionales bacterium]|nr:glucose-6-phosphate isomerase [Bdellovibrionales bacterium]
MIEIAQPRKSDPLLRQRLEEAWQKVLNRPEVGFPQIPERDEDWSALEERLDACRNARRVLVVGIGGSSLGTQVIYECFRTESAAELVFLEAPSPHQWNILRALGPDWLDNHLVIVSKSGNTLETLSWVERLAAQEPSWLNPAQTTVIASPGEGPLQTWAKQQDIPTLWIPKNVGGRFSVLTAVSMFPAGLMGLSLHEFREGANWALERPALATQLSTEILASWERGQWITQMWTYSESLKFFGEWWQQLWGESLGKKLTRDGKPAPRVSTPMSCRGPRDQHSLVQQLIDGTPDKFAFVNRVRAVEEADESFKPRLFPQMPFFGKEMSLGHIMGAEAEAFEKSLYDAKIDFVSLGIEGLGERTLGAMFMIWQMTIAQLGEHLGIDAFDQPGVELGKRHASQILRQ